MQTLTEKTESAKNSRDRMDEVANMASGKQKKEHQRKRKKSREHFIAMELKLKYQIRITVVVHCFYAINIYMKG